MREGGERKEGGGREGDSLHSELVLLPQLHVATNCLRQLRDLGLQTGHLLLLSLQKQNDHQTYMYMYSVLSINARDGHRYL